ncbi:MAG TPA: cyclopropane fatty acyl phospholipid synthase [Kofleriaceae bacterium]|jgi:cyclopropane-fatty-acyl-phospholipid synthase|nr:cyclopropane fatty acyl phospholipid synthase [Kofleriaceae bacterium]
MVATATRKLLSSLDPRRAQDLFLELLAKADVQVGGSRPWDLQIHDERIWTRLLRDGTLGAGETYVDGWWDTPALDQFMDHILRARFDESLRENWTLVAQAVRARVLNLQSITRSFDNGQHHYDIGNDLYEPMLGGRLLYTCAYWHNATTLDEAQDAKLDLVCRKIGLRAGMRVLDLGCGWGGFAAFAAERYGVTVTGYTVSQEQVRWAKDHYPQLPIDIRLDDYRNATGTFDAVVSIGLMEHVGWKNYRGYMQLVDRLLAPGGVAFIHTIAGNIPRAHIEPWFDKYIFPNAVLPTLARVTSAMEGILIPEDVHNIGEHYDRTLMAWWHNFDAAWPTLRARYGDTFYRRWKYYLLTCAGAFRARSQQLFQIVMTRPGTPAPPGRRS